ncbi:MAG: hypothetical protein Q7S63_02605 [bacterium]|nr:hypothetical protein [bacterium]
MDTKRFLPLVSAVLLITAVVAGYFILKKLEKPQISPIEEEQKGLGGELYEQSQNPAEQLPDTNPFQVKTNPLDQAKTNPFEGLYKNPFQ